VQPNLPYYIAKWLPATNAPLASAHHPVAIRHISRHTQLDPSKMLVQSVSMVKYLLVMKIMKWQIYWRINSSIFGCMKWCWTLLMALMRGSLRIWKAGSQTATQT